MLSELKARIAHRSLDLRDNATRELSELGRSAIPRSKYAFWELAVKTKYTAIPSGLVSNSPWSARLNVNVDGFTVLEVCRFPEQLVRKVKSAATTRGQLFFAPEPHLSSRVATKIFEAMGRLPRKIYLRIEAPRRADLNFYITK